MPRSDKHNDATAEQARPVRTRREGIGVELLWLAMIGASIANVVVVLTWTPLCFVTPGTPIRPMIEAGIALTIGLGSALLAPVSIVAIVLLWRSRLRARAILALVLSLSPIPLTVIMLNGISFLLGLRIEE